MQRVNMVRKFCCGKKNWPEDETIVISFLHIIKTEAVTRGVL